MRFVTIVKTLVVMTMMVVGAFGCSNKECPTLPPAQDEYGLYAGAEKCGSCHQSIYANFVTSGHNQHVQEIVGGEGPQYFWEELVGLPVPGPPNDLSWDAVSLVIGGTNVYSVFIDTTGTVITGERALWDGELGEWQEFYDGEGVPFNCGTCHFTGYGFDDTTLPKASGGSWVDKGVSCESCHGPGGVHASTGSALDITVDLTDELCQSCHDLSQGHSSPAAGSTHGAQSHFGVGCGVCHDPHASVRYDREGAIGVECWDCHRSNKAEGAAHSVRLN